MAAEGWFAGRARKAHYFVQGRSLCGKWTALRVTFEDNQRLTESPGPDDCKACHRKAVARKDSSAP